MTNPSKYEPRFYREGMGNNRWETFRVTVEETDVWVAISKGEYVSEIEGYTQERIRYYRRIIEDYSVQFPEFYHSFSPVDIREDAPPLVVDMLNAAAATNTGPMASVAGAIAELICFDITKEFGTQEVVVENGGDIFMQVNKPTTISIYAGNSPLSEKIAIVVHPSNSPLSLCSSSGTVGHAKSLGTADACMVACKSGALADAWATAYGNMVKSDESVLEVTELALSNPEILSIVIVRGEKIGMGGMLEVKVL